ncbi:MAG: putative Fe-S protein YdhL (DUF1289 family) [Reinekea sp.]|jgi:predicted Fe-S protein YdhL (DUF1289 family)
MARSDRLCGVATMSNTYTRLQSPCVKLCTLDDADTCLGCGRSLADIKNWSIVSPAEQQQILDRAEHRLIKVQRC